MLKNHGTINSRADEQYIAVGILEENYDTSYLLNMSKCDHIAWLELVEGKAGPLLAYGSRFARVVGELQEPSKQFPQVIFFMGRKEKNAALRRLCRNNYRGHHSQTINLRTDNSTIKSDYPRLFADCDPTYQVPSPAIDSLG